MTDLSWLSWLFFVAQFFVPLYQKRSLEIHRQETSQQRPGVEFIPLPVRATDPGGAGKGRPPMTA